MNKKFPEIENIANTAREKFERGNLPKKALEKLYSKYNPNVDPESFVDEALRMFPNLNCGLASVYLQARLGGRIIQGKYNNHDHTFLLCGNVIIDITADQFAGPKVYVGKTNYPWKV